MMYERDELDDQMDVAVERLQKGGGRGAVYGFKADNHVFCVTVDHVATADECYNEFAMLFDLFKININDPTLLIDTAYHFEGLGRAGEMAVLLIKEGVRHLETN